MDHHEVSWQCGFCFSIHMSVLGTCFLNIPVKTETRFEANASFTQWTCNKFHPFVRCVWAIIMRLNPYSHKIYLIKGKDSPLHNWVTRGDIPCLIKHHAVKTYGVEVSLACGQLHAPVGLPPGRGPDTHWVGGSVGLRSGLDEVAKRKKMASLRLPGTELRSSNPYLVTIQTELPGHGKSVWNPRVDRSIVYRKHMDLRHIEVTVKWTS
jgi:hypothetical protein